MELLHRRCCGLDVHKETVVACLRLVSDGKVMTEVRTFQTTTADLLRLSEWLAANECTHVAMEATERQLSAGPILPHQSPPWRQKGDHGCRRLDPYCHLPHAQGRHDVQGPWLQSLRSTFHRSAKKRLVKRLTDLGYAVEIKPLAA
jgi:hypothetical protein